MGAGDYPGPDSFPVGSEVAGYRLEEKIGRGGMAFVYRARDVQLGRYVALKVLSPALSADEAFRQRFVRESRAAAAVDHPHIIPIFGAGESNGVLYIAMRYVQGGDVRRLIDDNGPLPADRAIGIITQVASALDAAHLHGLIHRDIKPANMLLDSAAGSGLQDHVYLADFGLSKRSLSATGLTSIGQFLGTPAYVAPEQVEGATVDGRADLYALACAGFEMLCGTPPFERDDDLAVMWAQVSAPPPSLRARRPDLPAAVDGVMNRALAKSPADRFPACLAFAAALRAALGYHGRPSGRGSQDAAAPPAGLGPTAGRRDPDDHPPTEISLPRGGHAAAEWPGDADQAAAAQWDGDANGPPEAAPPADVDPPTEGWVPPFGEGRPPLVDLPPVSAGAGGPPRRRRPPSRPRGRGRPGRRRSLWWPRGAVVIGCAIVIGLAIGVIVALTGGKGPPGGVGKTSGVGATGNAVAAPSVPGCSTAVAKPRTLTDVRSAVVSVGGQPFGLATTADGTFTFVPRGDSVAVLSDGPSLAPALNHVISAPGVQNGAEITHDGRYLIAAVNSGAMVINVAAAEQGSAPIVGTLTSPFGSGAVEVAISPDDKFVFVTLQSSADMVVFNLQTALAKGFGPADVVGKVSLGQQPVGLAMSPDGRWLYATSMARTQTANASEGTVSVIDVNRAEVTPSAAVVSTAVAGCSPVRVTTSPDGSDVWVTSRESDALLGFSAARLRSDPAHALIARVNVGAAPIGLTMVDNGSRILVADSNLRNQANATAGVTVVSTSAALRGAPALLGQISTGLVPRQFTVQPGGRTALVSVNGSGQVQAIDLATLP